MGNAGNQRDYEPVHFRLKVFPETQECFQNMADKRAGERENPATDSGNPSEKTMDGFVEVTEQMELPF